MKTISFDEQLQKNFRGQSTMRLFEPGALQRWLESGLTLKQAQSMAAEYGEEIGRGCVVSNLVVNAGLNLAGDMLIDAETVGLTYHAVGTGSATPAPGDVALSNEVTRKLWTLRGRSGPVVSLSVFYLASECPYYIRECGVFGGAAAAITPGSGTLFSHYLQTPAYNNSNPATRVDITFDYNLTLG